MAENYTGGGSHRASGRGTVPSSCRTAARKALIFEHGHAASDEREGSSINHRAHRELPEEILSGLFSLGSVVNYTALGEERIHHRGTEGTEGLHTEETFSVVLFSVSSVPRWLIPGGAHSRAAS